MPKLHSQCEATPDPARVHPLPAIWAVPTAGPQNLELLSFRSYRNWDPAGSVMDSTAACGGKPGYRCRHTRWAWMVSALGLMRPNCGKETTHVYRSLTG